MADEQRGISLVILGIVAVVAVVGLVLMFSRPGLQAQLVNPAPGVVPGKSGYFPPPESYPVGEEPYGGGARPGPEAGAYRYSVNNPPPACQSVCPGPKCEQCVLNWASKQTAWNPEPTISYG